MAKKTGEFTTKQDVEKFFSLRSVKAFFRDKENQSEITEKDVFEALTTCKSKWTPPEGQFASIDFFYPKMPP